MAPLLQPEAALMQFSVGLSTVIIAEKGTPIPQNLRIEYDNASMQAVYSLCKSLLSGTSYPAKEFVFWVGDIQESILQLHELFEVVHSAGGIVEAEGKLLFIKRKGRWDLPKGKVEAGEDYPTAAVREIQEETGVTATVMAHLLDTWHAYDDFGPLTLKCTHWFWLQAPFACPTNPQNSEGIAQAEWLSPQQARDAASQSFTSIQHALRAYEFRQFQSLLPGQTASE